MQNTVPNPQPLIQRPSQTDALQCAPKPIQTPNIDGSQFGFLAAPQPQSHEPSLNRTASNTTDVYAPATNNSMSGQSALSLVSHEPHLVAKKTKSPSGISDHRLCPSLVSTNATPESQFRCPAVHHAMRHLWGFSCHQPRITWHRSNRLDPRPKVGKASTSSRSAIPKVHGKLEMRTLRMTRRLRSMMAKVSKVVVRRAMRKGPQMMRTDGMRTAAQI